MRIAPPVKRGVVKCLHDRARRIISMQDNLQKEVDHLARVLKQNGYPAYFICNASVPPTQETAYTSSCDEEQEERGPLVVILAGISEDIRNVCRKFEHQSNLYVRVDSPLNLNEGQRYLLISKPMWYIIPSVVVAGLYQGDQMETGDETEGTPRCMREGDDGEVSYSGACIGEPPTNPLGGNHSAGPWQRIVVGEGGHAHPDNTLIEALQPRWRTGSPWLLDLSDEEAGREKQSPPAFDLQ